MAIVEADRFKIYLRPRWDQPWEESEGWMRDLSVIKITSRVAPGVSEAQFRLRTGMIKLQALDAYFEERAQNLNEQFIRVVLDTDEAMTLFVGVISVSDQDVRGVISGAADSGDIIFTAYGLEHLLDRVHIHAGYSKPTDTLEADVVKMDWSPTFNVRQRRGGAITGNRSQTMTNEIYAFASVPGNANDPAALWTHRQIFDYLLLHFSPAASQGMVWNIAGQFDVLDNLVTVQDVEGLKLREALNRLIYRGWGLGWRVFYDEDADRPAIQVFTYLSEPVTVDDLVIPANETVEERTIDDSALTSGAFIKTATAARYETIVVQGARVKTCFTLSHADSTLTNGWTSSLESAYKTAKGAAASAEENAAERSRDRYAPVFSRFRVPGTWDGKAGDGAGGTKYTAFPDVDEDGNLDLSADTEKFGGPLSRAFLRRLPLRKGYDYTASPPTPLIDNDDTSEFLAPIVLVKDDETLGWFLHAEKASGIKEDGASARQNARIRPDDAQLALWIAYRPYNHILARNHWAGANESKYNPEDLWATDWEDMVITVAMACDARLRVVTRMEPGADLDRLLIIDVPDAELWYVLPGTVVSISDTGALQRIAGSSDGILRNDGERLRRIAALAARWYGQIRTAIAMTSYDLNNYSAPGVLLTCKVVNGATDDVTGVVTSVEWDGVSRKVTTRTDFIDLDVVALASGLTGSAQITSREDLVRTVRKQGGAIAELEERTGNLPVRGAGGPFDQERYVILAAAAANYAWVDNGNVNTNNQSEFWVAKSSVVGQTYEYRTLVHSDEILGTDSGLIIEDLTCDLRQAMIKALQQIFGPPEFGYVCEVRLELRPVLTDFDPATVTWNVAYVTDGGLTYGAAVLVSMLAVTDADGFKSTTVEGGSNWTLVKFPTRIGSAWDTYSKIYGFELRFVEAPGTVAFTYELEVKKLTNLGGYVSLHAITP